LEYRKNSDRLARSDKRRPGPAARGSAGALP